MRKKSYLCTKIIKVMALNIKAAIKRYGLTSKELAEKMGINPVTLSYHVNGNPSVQVLYKIADGIGCHVTELFDPPTDEKKVVAAVSQEQQGNGRAVCPHCGKPLVAEISFKATE